MRPATGKEPEGEIHEDPTFHHVRGCRGVGHTYGWTGVGAGAPLAGLGRAGGGKSE